MVASGEFLAGTGRGRLWDLAAGLLILEEAGAAVEVRPAIETLDLPTYADAPEEHRIFHLFAHGNEHLPSLQERFDAETSTR
jgi:hypothetical protein